MRKALKITALTLGGIVIVLLFGAAYINFSSIPSYETHPPELSVSLDSVRLAEGKRIATLVCQNCHMSKNRKMEGAYMIDLPPSFGKAWIPNITKHPNSKLAGYTDGELAYLLRTGVKRDGSYAPPWMPKFPHLSDEDLYSIIAYLRSDYPELEPSDLQQPKPQPSFLVKMLCRVAFKPLPYPEEPIIAPPKTDQAETQRI